VNNWIGKSSLDRDMGQRDATELDAAWRSAFVLEVDEGGGFSAEGGVPVHLDPRGSRRVDDILLGTFRDRPWFARRVASPVMHEATWRDVDPGWQEPVAAAVALAGLSGWQTNGSAFAQLCSDAEWYVGTRGGIMDQFVSLFSQREHALFLDCRPDAAGEYHYQTIPLPAAYRLLVVDSGVHHGNVRGEFNQRVAACRAGVRLLQQSYPGITHLRDVHQVDWQELEAALPETVTTQALHAQGIDLGEIPGLDRQAPLRVRACCRHVWTENHRVEAALVAMQQNKIDELGRLLTAAHNSARDDYAISCPELETLIRSAGEVDGVAGARLTGAGWGGCMVALVHETAVAEFERHVPQRFQTQFGRSPAIFPCQAGPGAGHVITIDDGLPV